MNQTHQGPCELSFLRMTGDGEFMAEAKESY
jgi:hypothetical protein